MLRSFLTAVYPLNCLGCERPLSIDENKFCLHCYSGFVFLSHTTNIVDQLFWGKAHVKRGVSVFSYVKDESLSTLIHAFKYDGNIRLGKALGLLMGEAFQKVRGFSDIDCVSFVPMHRKKKRKRGYNQAEILASEIAKKNNLAGEKLIYRTEKTETQTNQDVFGRYENMDGTFAVFPKKESYSHILLVDDVITTGATLIECVNLLIKEYSCEVSVFTLAYRDI